MIINLKKQNAQQNCAFLINLRAFIVFFLFKENFYSSLFSNSLSLLSIAFASSLKTFNSSINISFSSFGVEAEYLQPRPQPRRQPKPRPNPRPRPQPVLCCSCHSRDLSPPHALGEARRGPCHASTELTERGTRSSCTCCNCTATVAHGCSNAAKHQPASKSDAERQFGVLGDLA